MASMDDRSIPAGLLQTDQAAPDLVCLLTAPHQSFPDRVEIPCSDGCGRAMSQDQARYVASQSLSQIRRRVLVGAMLGYLFHALIAV